MIKIIWIVLLVLSVSVVNLALAQDSDVYILLPNLKVCQTNIINSDILFRSYEKGQSNLFNHKHVVSSLVYHKCGDLYRINDVLNDTSFLFSNKKVVLQYDSKEAAKEAYVSSLRQSSNANNDTLFILTKPGLFVIYDEKVSSIILLQFNTHQNLKKTQKILEYYRKNKSKYTSLYAVLGRQIVIK